MNGLALSPELQAEKEALIEQLRVGTQIIIDAFKPHMLTKAEAENLEHSAIRSAKALADIIATKGSIVSTLQHVLKDSFPSEESPRNGFMILAENPIQSASLCPHHLLPVMYETFIAVKLGNGGVYGLSKYTRAIQVLAARPVLQEQYTRDIVQLFTQGIIGGSVPTATATIPGCMVVVKGIHGCMVCRGIRSLTPTTTIYHEGMSEEEVNKALALYKAGA